MQDGLLTNLIGFNVGVELGQFAALGILLIAFDIWRRRRHFMAGAYLANTLLMAAGFLLFSYQLTGYFYTV